MTAWLVAFAATVAIELGVLWLLFRKERRLRAVLAASVVVNAATHPFVWFLFPRVLHTYGDYILVAELFAFAVEIPLLAALLRPRPWYRAISAAALANLASYGVGLVWRWLYLA